MSSDLPTLPPNPRPDDPTCLVNSGQAPPSLSATGPPRQFGDYELLSEVARGGMGVVYKARQISLNRIVALKMILAGQLASEGDVERFRLEARTAAALQHPNIVAIHEVGEIEGQHFFSMDFVEGKSLAEMVKDNPLPPAQALRYVHLMAQAIHHAHEQGVLHRDLKPANVLIDRFDLPRITDFGLAKQTRGDAGLTASGAVLGTPGYMPPEQASGGKAGPASDVYSLGAVLYELVTGRPPFRAATALDTILQVLQDDPAPPRLLNPAISRDLETVILKCLAKDPARRYPTAQELAADLGALIEGRPIRARRPGMIERTVRWVRQHHRTATLVTVSAGAAVLLAVAVLVGLEQYRHWQTGSLYLANEGQVLTGELLDETGQRVQPRFTVPTEEPLPLLAGKYQLRLRGRGFLEEMVPVRIERGKELAINVSLSEQRLWEPITVPKCFETIRISGRHDLLSLSATGVSRLHGVTGKVIWTANLGEKDHPALAGLRWDWDVGRWPSGRNEVDRRPRLLEPAPDLDGDGTPDLVWISQRQAAVLALSGKTGKVLWCFQAPLAPFAPNSDFARPSASTGTVLGIGILPDVDGDGVPDLVGTFASQKMPDGSVPRWVQALSGRTGKSLWRSDLDGSWFVPPAGASVPRLAVWNNLLGVGSSISGSTNSSVGLLYEHDRMDLGGGVPVPYPASVVQAGGRPLVLLTAGTRLVGLDPRTGVPTWPPHAIGFWPLRPPQLADLDGDGQPDVLLLGPGESAHPQPPLERLELVALGLTTRKLLWRTPFRAYWYWHWYQQPFTWPVIADLDGDGKAEVIVPAGEFEGDTKWSGIQVHDGTNGTVRWQRTLTRSSLWDKLQQVNQIIVRPAPPGGEGCVFTAVMDSDFVEGRSSRTPGSKDASRPVVLADALAGSDGRPLWWSRQQITSGSGKPSVGPLQWWINGKDGWPQLVVPYVPGSPQNEALRHMVYFLSAGTGKLQQTGTDYRDLRILDLDGDGMPDLLSFRPSRAAAFDHGGSLETIRGRSHELWRHVGGIWQVAGGSADDDIPDLVTAEPGEERRRELVRGRERNEASRASRSPDWRKPQEAISGRTGEIRWQRTITDSRSRSIWANSMYTRLWPLDAGVDLNGDGTADLLVTGRGNMNFSNTEGFSPLLAVSGRTGERLWEADIRVTQWLGPQLLQCRDLDGDGKPEVLFVSALKEKLADDGGQSPNDWRYWLLVLSGHDGKVRWRQPLCGPGPHNSQAHDRLFSCVLADLNGDGVQDVIIEAGEPGADGEVRAFSGKDGALLWQWKPPQGKRLGSDRSRPTLAVGDLDGDGRVEVVVLHTVGVPDPRVNVQLHAEVVALDGKTGRPRWSWREPVADQYNSAVWSRVVPILVRRGSKKVVCVCTYNYTTRGEVVLLDPTGKEVRRENVRFRLNGEGWRHYRDDPQGTYAPYYSGLFRVWAMDLDGDGNDELVFFTRTSLRVTSGSLDRVRWEWPLPEEDCDLLDVRAQPSGPPLLAVRAGNRVVFLGDSPKPVWTCVGSGRPMGVAWSKEGPPRVFFEQDNEVTVCRLAQADSEGSWSGTLPIRSNEEDPRFVVSLPWNSVQFVPPLLPTTPLALLLALLAVALAVVVLPVALTVWAIRRRAWLRIPLALLCLALCWTAAHLLYRARLEDEALVVIYLHGEVGLAWRVGLGLLLTGLAGVPAVAFAAVMLLWLRRRQWTKLLLLLAASVALAAVAGWFWTWALASPLGPEQSYSWRGWYGVWPAGASAAGLLVIVAVLAGRLMRLIRAGWKKVSLLREPSRQ